MFNQDKRKIQFLGKIKDIDFFNFIDSWENLKVIDIGCGKGDLVFSLSERGAEAIGLEPDFLQLQADGRVNFNNKIHLINGSADSVPFVDSFFDYVVFCKSLHHVPVDLMGKALIEAMRILHPENGKLIVLEPDIEGEFSKLIKPFHDETFVRAKAIESLKNVVIDNFKYFHQYKYTSTHKFINFNSFFLKMSSATYNDLDVKLIDAPDIRKNFQLGKKDNFFVFTNPINAYIFFNHQKTKK